MPVKFHSETLVHRVIIKPFIQKETASGIVIARDERSQAINSDKGTVFMVGPYAWKTPPFNCEVAPVKEGDEVYYAKYGAKVLKDDETGELYIICNDEDILVGYSQDDTRN